MEEDDASETILSFRLSFSTAKKLRKASHWLILSTNSLFVSLASKVQRDFDLRFKKISTFFRGVSSGITDAKMAATNALPL